MPSTYSTNLALELIGTGDQTGTWGTTTNTNLGTLLEQAISGYTTQAMADANQTVTIPNGASGTARNMTIECTGALTAARTLTVPANKKIYFIYNNTTGGYAITVKVSGQTGVAVPSGSKALLVCNGTDVVSATNYMASLTLGTPLPVASGGSGTAYGEFPSGTRILFQQTAAPTGWTKDTTATYNDSALRIVTGAASTGGATAFTTVFGASVNTGSYTLLAADIPAHTHTGPAHTHTFSGTTSGASNDHTHGTVGPFTYVDAGSSGSTGVWAGGNVGATSGGQSADHSHTYSGTTSSDGTGATGSYGGSGGHQHTMSMNIKYTDSIIAFKN